MENCISWQQFLLAIFWKIIVTFDLDYSIKNFVSEHPFHFKKKIP
jgi:hypothetical protein